MTEWVPEWVPDHLKEYANPTSQIALPNFVAEFKGESSMKIAHQQARLDGGVAAKGFYTLYRDYNVPENCLGQALVGSLEFNPEVVIGNVHWATESKSKTGEVKVEYYMCRVMAHFTRGLNFEEFVRNRREARNFRIFFANIREEILKELNALPEPAKRGPNYDAMKKPQLQDECKRRHLRQGGNISELKDRLRAYDARRPNLEASVATSHADTRMTPDNRFTPSVGSIITSPVVHSRTPRTPRRRKSREDDEHREYGGPAKKLNYGA